MGLDVWVSHCTQQICSWVEGSAGKKHGLSEQPWVIISCRHA